MAEDIKRDSSKGAEFDVNSMTGYLNKSGAVVSVTSNSPGAKSTNPSPDVTTQNAGQSWAIWGTNNNFPNEVMKLAGANNVVPTMLNFMIRLIYGKGIIPCTVTVDETGKETVVPCTDKRVLQFFKENNIKKWFLELVTDYVYFGQAFPEIILNKRRDYIGWLYSNEAAYCRWELINPKSRLIENCYVSANWPNPTEAEYIKVPALDMYDPINALNNGSAYKYILNVSLPSPGRSYYQRSFWDAARENGTIETSNDIVKARRSLFKRQMGWQWHVEIPYEYFERKFDEAGKELSREEKVKIIQDEMTNMDNYLSGAENMGKAFYTFCGYDEVKGVAKPGWKIIPLDDKMKDGKWLPDSSALYSEILFAGGLAPSIIGAGTPGNGLAKTAGGGSDSREAFLIKTAQVQLDRDECLNPLYIIRDFNGWPDDLQFRVIDQILTTLDKGKGTEKVLS